MKTTLIGWYNYDNTIFDGMVVPSGLSKQTAIDSILMRCGEFSIIYSNLDFLKFAITNWSERHKAQFENIKTAIEEKYNPLHNYDRYEEYSDEKTNKQTGSGKTKLTNDKDGTIENLVSADNSSDYQPDNKSIEDTSITENTELNNEVSGNETIKHEAHLYGNIGVTTSQKMLTDEIDLRYTFGVYDLIAAKFMEEFCIAIY